MTSDCAAVGPSRIATRTAMQRRAFHITGRRPAMWDDPAQQTPAAPRPHAPGTPVAPPPPVEVKMQHSFSRQIHEGMEVLDKNGEKIGMAGETLGDYFNVDAGFLGMKEYYVPFSAISDVSENSVFLNVLKDQVGDMGWDQKPEMASGERTYATGERAYTTGERRETLGATTTDQPDRTVQLREEELQARKTPVETGRVQLGKDVVEEQRTMNVPVSREEVYVERRPVDRQPTDQPISESESESIRVPVREERVEVEKQPVVYEEVGIGKRTTQETQQVSDTVRREELRTDREGDIDLRERDRDRDNP
jgi:uncharacterized protein (TIGR02271 family)